MSHQTHAKEDSKNVPKHDCPLCGTEITIRDAFTHERCPDCEASLQEMQRAANKEQ